MKSWELEVNSKCKASKFGSGPIKQFCHEYLILTWKV